VEEVRKYDDVGTVCKEDDFFYLKLSQRWQDNAGYLLESLGEIFRYDKKLKANQAKLRRHFETKESLSLRDEDFKFYTPLSGVGLHISLEANNDDLGKKVKFRVEDLIIQRANIGIPSHHNERFYHCQWLALAVSMETRVKGEDGPGEDRALDEDGQEGKGKSGGSSDDATAVGAPAALAPLSKGRAHISLACYGVEITNEILKRGRRCSSTGKSMADKKEKSNGRSRKSESTKPTDGTNKGRQRRKSSSKRR